MNTHIPTIQDLNRKTESELQVMFRNAASIATSGQRSPEERAAAREVLEVIRRCLAAKAFHP